MTNALFGFANHALSGTFSASASVAGLSPDQLGNDQGATSTSWQTPAGTTTAHVVLDAGAEVEWGAVALCNTNLTPAATLRWRLSNDPAFAASPVWDTGAAPAVVTGYRQAVAVEPAALQSAATANRVRNPRAAGAVVGTPGTLPTNWSTLTFDGVSRQVVGAGVDGGLPYLDVRFFGTPTATSSNAHIRFDAVGGIPATVGQIWTSSFFVRLIGGSLANVTVNRQLGEFSSSFVFLSGTSSAIVPTAGALAQQRWQHTRTISSASVAFVAETIFFSYTNGQPIDVTLRFGAPQLELGATATTPLLPPARARYLRCDIADPTNPATFLRAAQLYAGPVARPVRNIGYETAFARAVDAPALVTRGGQEFPILRHTRRSWRIALPSLAEDEVWPLVDALQLAAADGRNVLFIPFPAGPNVQREAVFGRLTDPAPITWPHPSPIRRAWSCTITERL